MSSGLRRITGKFFIDASGDADLCRFAGLPTWKLPKDMMQAHTLCAILSGYDAIRAKYPKFSFGEIMKPEYGAGLKHMFGWTRRCERACQGASCRQGYGPSSI